MIDSQNLVDGRQRFGNNACRIPNGKQKQRQRRQSTLKTLCLWLVMVVPVRSFHNPTRNRGRLLSAATDRYSNLDPNMFSFMDLASSAGDSTGTMHVSTQSAIIAAGLLLIAPVLVAAVQGGTAVINFRANYADAPLPKIPSHGVVIAGRDSLPVSDESLRLLVIGDSLAVGVGQSVSCTPLMPEAIATQIACFATGKAVYWTCFGETGASTPWIIRMIEEANIQKYSEFKVPDEAKNDWSAFQAEGSLLDEETIEEWKQKLYLYRQSFRELYFDPESWGTFDIVVLVTGTNDLKATIFPFLLDEEDKELRRQIKLRKGGVIQDVELFIETLNRKMERGLQSTLDEILTSAEELSETVRQNLDQMEFMFDGSSNSTSIQGIQKTDSSTASVLESTQDVNSDSRSEKEEFIAPLFVLPGSPIRLVPAFRIPPLQWLAVPVFDFMDDMKKAFAFNNPSDILFVDDPSLDEAIDYESRQGKLWNEKQREQILLKVKAVSSTECDNIEEKMKTYYESKGVMYDTVNSEVPLSRWPGKPGTNIFSCDKIHPNEAGYDMYGTKRIDLFSLILLVICVRTHIRFHFRAAHWERHCSAT